MLEMIKTDVTDGLRAAGLESAWMREFEKGKTYIGNAAIDLERKYVVCDKILADAFVAGKARKMTKRVDLWLDEQKYEACDHAGKEHVWKDTTTTLGDHQETTTHACTLPKKTAARYTLYYDFVDKKTKKKPAKKASKKKADEGEDDDGGDGEYEPEAKKRRKDDE